MEVRPEDGDGRSIEAPSSAMKSRPAQHFRVGLAPAACSEGYQAKRLSDALGWLH